APGDALEPSSVEIREVEWSGRTAPPARPGSTALRARRPVAAGEPLTRAQVEAAPEVARGAAATLRARRGAVELESRVEILEDGFAGQSVHVRLPGASSAIAARVTGPGTVEVIP
ncbi:MAG TPA: flagellar basal body P-ring formation chaperone FlgA, partial [Anaeromyxobacter sp.]|nr:flagellar basal body P-ring formation chaperone FlgA [Anaeromyxobacter sp.]